MPSQQQRIPVAEAATAVVELAPSAPASIDPSVGLPTTEGLVVQNARLASTHPSEIETPGVATSVQRDRLHLTEREHDLFNYRSSAKVCAYIDFGCLLIQALFVRSGIQLAFVLLACVGPLCGFQSTNTLNLPAAVGYLVVCLGKAGVYIWATATVPTLFSANFFLLALYLLVQLIILHQVYQYTHGLAMVPGSRLEELRDPKFLREAFAQHVLETAAREAADQSAAQRRE